MVFQKEFDTTIDRVGKHFVVVGRRENVKQTKEEVGKQARNLRLRWLLSTLHFRARLANVRSP